jgi:hypothetical protein
MSKRIFLLLFSYFFLQIAKQLDFLCFSFSTDDATVTKEELLKAMTQFQWYPKPTITYANDKTSFPRNQTKFESEHRFKVSFIFICLDQSVLTAIFFFFQLKGCASAELGAHALVKFSNRLGYEFGSSVVCLSHLIHRDPKAIYSSYMKDVRKFIAVFIFTVLYSPILLDTALGWRTETRTDFGEIFFKIYSLGFIGRFIKRKNGFKLSMERRKKQKKKQSDSVFSSMFWIFYSEV